MGEMEWEEKIAVIKIFYHDNYTSDNRLSNDLQGW